MIEALEVVVRLRPRVRGEIVEENEVDNNPVSINETKQTVIVQRLKSRSRAEFKFSSVLNLGSTQIDLYQCCRVIKNVLDGINCCVMAYGQTNTGKTYSLYGRGWEDDHIAGIAEGMSENLGKSTREQEITDSESAVSNNSNNDDDNLSVIAETQNETAEELGVIPRAIAELFQTMEVERERRQEFEYSISLQIMQIYNEKIYDLLRDKRREHPLSIRETNSSQTTQNFGSSVYVRGISVYRIDTKAEAFRLLKQAIRNKVVRSTEMNSVSSRSHTVLQLFIMTEDVDPDGIKFVRRSTLSLIDLAGSEKWRPALANSSQEMETQLKEMNNINTSLHVLGNCIAALIEGDRKHISYRDSVLTRLLQSTLSGHGRSILVATISPELENLEETYSTLQFANRASKVKMSLVSNVKVSDRMSLSDAQRQIQQLQKQLQQQQQQSSSTNIIPQSQMIAVCTSCVEYQEQVRQLQKRMEKLEKQNATLKATIASLQQQAAADKNNDSESLRPKSNADVMREWRQDELSTRPDMIMAHVSSSNQQGANADSTVTAKRQPSAPSKARPTPSATDNGKNDETENSKQHQSHHHQEQKAAKKEETVSVTMVTENTTSNTPMNFDYRQSSYNHQQQQSLMGTPASLAGSIVTHNSLTAYANTGVCKKHNLQDCVLCAMFGPSYMQPLQQSFTAASSISLPANNTNGGGSLASSWGYYGGNNAVGGGESLTGLIAGSLGGGSLQGGGSINLDELMRSSLASGNSLMSIGQPNAAGGGLGACRQHGLENCLLCQSAFPNHPQAQYQSSQEKLNIIPPKQQKSGGYEMISTLDSPKSNKSSFKLHNPHNLDQQHRGSYGGQSTISGKDYMTNASQNNAHHASHFALLQSNGHNQNHQQQMMQRASIAEEEDQDNNFDDHDDDVLYNSQEPVNTEDMNYLVIRKTASHNSNNSNGSTNNNHRSKRVQEIQAIANLRSQQQPSPVLTDIKVPAKKMYPRSSSSPLPIGSSAPILPQQQQQSAQDKKSSMKASPSKGRHSSAGATVMMTTIVEDDSHQHHEQQQQGSSLRLAIIRQSKAQNDDASLEHEENGEDDSNTNEVMAAAVKKIKKVKKKKKKVAAQAHGEEIATQALTLPSELGKVINHRTVISALKQTRRK